MRPDLPTLAQRLGRGFAAATIAVGSHLAVEKDPRPVVRSDRSEAKARVVDAVVKQANPSKPGMDYTAALKDVGHDLRELAEEALKRSAQTRKEVAEALARAQTRGTTPAYGRRPGPVQHQDPKLRHGERATRPEAFPRH